MFPTVPRPQSLPRHLPVLLPQTNTVMGLLKSSLPTKGTLQDRVQIHAMSLSTEDTGRGVVNTMGNALCPHTAYTVGRRGKAKEGDPGTHI